MAALASVALFESIAHAQDGKPVSARAASERAALAEPRAPSASAVLHRLPRGTVAALWAPNIGQAASDLEALQATLRLVEPELESKWMASLSGGPDDKSEPAAHAFVARLLDPGALAGTGIDANGPLAVYLAETGGAAVIGMGLSDRPEFERWLAAIGRADLKRALLAGEQAAVLGASDDVPLACVSRVSHAYCQIGASPGDKPLALLAEALEQNAAKPAPGSSNYLRAYEALPKGAGWYLVFDPALLVERGARRRAELLRHEHRFDPAPDKKAIEERIKEDEPRSRGFARIFDGAAMSLAREPRGVQLTLELGLSGMGGRALQALAPNKASSTPLARWSRTPALVHGYVQLHPQRISALAQRLGAELPADALDGSAALLVLGVDCDCDAAKRSAREDPLDWAFLFPSAIAVGLAAEQGHKKLPAEYRPSGDGVAPADAVSEQGPRARYAFDRHTPSGDYRVQVLDDALLFGAGPGSASAALRRFSSLPAEPWPASAEPKLDLQIHLKAIDAAFAAASLGLEHRSELLMLEALRMKLKPLFERLDQIHLSARPSSAARRLHVEMQIGN